MNNKIFGKVIAEKRAKCSSKKPRYALRKLSIGVVSCLIGYAFLIGGNVSFAETDTNSSAQFVEFIEKAEKEETTKEIAKETPEKNTEKTPENSEDISDEKIDTKKVESVNKKELMATENVKEMEENPVHKEQFTVVFDANGGKFDTENNTLTVKAGENVTFSETPTLAGKVFVGWANSIDATEAQEDILQNITANKTVYAVWKNDDKDTLKKHDKPIVTATKPEDVSDYLSLNFNASSFMENDGTLHYGKILDKDNNEVENNNEIEGIKTRTYWVLKSATWKDVKNFTDIDGKSVYQNLTANSGDEKHPFLGWSDNSSLDNIVDLTSKFEDKSVIGESTKDGLNFYAKYKANDYVYYGKTDNSKPAYDSDGYKLNLKKDYKKVTFKIKDEKIGKVYLKEKQKKLIGKDVATKDDGSIKLEDATIGDKEITVFVERKKAKSTIYKGIKVETDSIDKDHQYWYWYRGEVDPSTREDDGDYIIPPSLNGIKDPDEVCFVPLFVTNGQDVTDLCVNAAPPKMPTKGSRDKFVRFGLVTLRKEEKINDILREDGKSYFGRTYVVFREYNADFIFKKHPPKNPDLVLPTLKEEFKDSYANPHWYDNTKDQKRSYYDDVDLSRVVIYKNKFFTARATKIPVVHKIDEIDESAKYIEGTAKGKGKVWIHINGEYITETRSDSWGRWKFEVKNKIKIKAGNEVRIEFAPDSRTVPASATFIVKKAKDNVKFTPVYEGAVVNPGDTAVINAPKFINDLNKSEAVDEPIAKKYELVDCAAEGIVIDEKTGEITYNMKESDADKTIDLKVKVTYLDDTTENVSTTIKINSLDEIINRKENPNAQTPEGYVRVTMKAGEGVQLKQETIYDIKKGLSLAADYYPEVEINPENKNDYKNPINWTIKPGEKIKNSVEIIANATKTQASVNEPIAKEIKILEGESVEAKDLVENSDAMPENTTFEFKEKPDTKTAGKFDATVIVKYSDGSIDEVKSKIIVQKQAAVITPIPTVEAADEIVEFGKNYDLTDNITNLPTGAKVEDITEKDAINTRKSGNYIGKIKVTFENGATRIVNVKVVVNKSLAETNEPTGKEIKILEGESVEAKDLVANSDDLPDNTTFEFKEKPDTKTAGKLNTTIIVKYSDESVDEVQSKIIVQKQAAVITPIPTVEAIDEIVDYGKTYNLTDNIKDLPSGAKVTDITEKDVINTNISGNYIGKIKVTFENGATRVVTVKVVVNKSLAETNEPTGKEIKILEGESVEAKDLVANSDAMPADTTFEFKEKPDTKTSGKFDATVIVKYSDESVDEVQSKIIVQKQAAIITPIPTVEAIDEIVDYGKTYDLTDNITNLPNGAKVTDITEKDAINTSKSGNYIGKIKVTFENGEARIVNVKVVVNKSLAETNELIGKEIKILEGETVEAKDLVENSEAMPADTTFEFKEKPETKTAGKLNTTIIVKYSDGSIDEVQSKIIVQKQAAVITPIQKVEAADEIVEFGKTYDLSDNIKNLPNGAKVTDITEKDAINTSKSGNYIGKIKVTFENGATRVVTVKVVVNKSLAEKFVPEFTKIEVEAGELTAEKLKTAIANLPQDSKIEIKSSAEGKAVVTIKFADGSEKEVEISYKIKENKTEVNPETNDNDENNEEDNKPEKEEKPDKEEDKKPEKEEDNKPEKDEKPGKDLVEDSEDNDNIKKPEEKIETKPEVNHQTSRTSEKSSTKPGKTTENIGKPNAEGIQIRFEKTNAKIGDKVLLKPIFTDKSGKVIDVPMDVEFSLEDNSPSGVKINQKTGELRFDTTGYKAGDRIELIVVTKFRGKTTQTFALFADDSVVKLPEKITSTTTPDFVIKTKVVINIVESENGKSKNISENKSEFTKSNSKSQLPKAGTQAEIANLTLAIVSCATGAYFTKKKK
ncbi:Rib/alpha-like domain-containing protein [Finegoldia magna]|uniref:Rib/alpha-like domain-containing protein n=1 Tax=Finegoldia magna TaxID=1260 RepID=UPI00290FA0A1|nr:Rib/alpha-like domain-containing protein [Finegoldia magna]MDU6598787.1 Rib/alpha-like domain-containing protein [Finegoldia magna]